jgi:cytochrome P450 family 142 subfamily A polypeptide 1
VTGDLDLRDPTFYKSDPQAVYAALRATPGLVRDRNGFVAVARHADVLTAERDTANLVSSLGYRVHHEPLEATMISQDDPGHLLQRRRLSSMLTPRAVESHGDGYRALVRSLVESACSIVRGSGAVEVVDALGAQLPCRVTAELIGFGAERWRDVKRWSEQQMRLDTRDVDPGAMDEFMGSINEWMAIMLELIPARTECPADDFISRWLHPHDGQEPLGFEPMVMEAGLLIAGGAETTRTVISHGLRIMCDYPEQWELLHREPSRIPAAVEELIRYVSPLNNMFRTAVADVTINGAPVSAGERLALLYPSANRDATVFDDPNRFDVTRPPAMHLAFGHGTHFCLGASVARLELRLLLEEMTARCTNLRVVTEPDVEPNVFARAVRRFDLTWDDRGHG